MNAAFMSADSSCGSTSSSTSTISSSIPVFNAGRLHQSFILRAHDFARGFFFGNANRGYVYSCPPHMVTPSEAKKNREFIAYAAASNEKYLSLPALAVDSSPGVMVRSLGSKGALCRELMPPHIQLLVRNWYMKRIESERINLQMTFWKELCPFVDLLLSPNVYVDVVPTCSSRDWALGVFARQELVAKSHLAELSGHLTKITPEQLAVLEREEFDLSIVESTKLELHESLLPFHFLPKKHEQAPIAALSSLRSTMKESELDQHMEIEANDSSSSFISSSSPTSSMLPLTELAEAASSASPKCLRQGLRAKKPPQSKLPRKYNLTSPSSVRVPCFYILSGPISFLNSSCRAHMNTVTHTRVPVEASDIRLESEPKMKGVPANMIVRNEWKSSTVGNRNIKKGEECTSVYNNYCAGKKLGTVEAASTASAAAAAGASSCSSSSQVQLRSIQFCVKCEMKP